MRRDLTRLLSPRSVAVIGGGYWCVSVIEQLHKIGFAGEVFAVHPTRNDVAGITTLANVAALPRAPDVAFVGINRHATITTIKALRDRGAGGAVCFASGFSEASGEDAEAGQLQAALIDAAGDMPILGPNCYGFVNALDRVAIWPDQHGLIPVERGVAILTQSSNIAINLSMQRRGLSIAAMVTVGNAAQTSMAEIATTLLADPRITALGLHIEGVGDIRAFEDMVATTNKPVIALKVGRSTVAQTAAVSHTASMSGSTAGSDALFARLGIGQTPNLSAFLDALHLLHLGGPLPHADIASLSCSGGEASLMADIGLRHPVRFPPLNTAQNKRLIAALGPMVALANPLDYHTYIWGDVARMTDAFAAMADPSLAMTLLVLDVPRADRCAPQAWDCAIKALIAARARTAQRFGVVSSLPETMPEEVALRFAQSGIAPLFDLDHGLAAIACAADTDPGKTFVPITLAKAPEAATLVDEPTSKGLLKDAGLSVCARAVVKDADAVQAFTATQSGPFVLKTIGAAHKSDTSGVTLNLNAKSALDAAKAMGFPLMIEPMVTGSIAELLVAVVRDPAHGFVLTIGAGGIHTEIFDDTAHLLIPAKRGDIDAALETLKIAPILRGYRGKPAVARNELLDNIEALQTYVIANAARIEEIEINPMICTKDAAIVADALIRMEVPCPKSS